MAEITLSKSSLLNEARRLDNFQRFLPSLELKRQQLVIESAAAEKRLLERKVYIAALQEKTADELQMLANNEIELNELVTITAVEKSEENLVGVTLPVVETIKLNKQQYGMLTRPHWVDLLVARVSQVIECQIELKNDADRLAILKRATRKATQRVNLVGKVLMPRARANIRKIQIFLSDNERAAVVRSKIAKRKHALLADQIEDVEAGN